MLVLRFIRFKYAAQLPPSPVQQLGVFLALLTQPCQPSPEGVAGSACTSTFSRLARRSLALRPAHSRGHQFVTRYPKASDISSPPCLLRLLPAGANRRVGLAPTGDKWRNDREFPTTYPNLYFGNTGPNPPRYLPRHISTWWRRTQDVGQMEGRPASAAYTVVEPRDHLWRFLAHNSKARLLPLARARARALPFGTSKMMDLVDAWDRRCFPMA
jgi:hypothetical protein